ncbi:MFS transporter, MHS family, proline/betaine transporter [Persephonella hydrogeniphila]|uniref:MFS transporter, MHS family, proline/betaine transporter n=1 Tax=Persephonella hydrogeniphila TaxID=198703 RepID=A0A285NG36_9AQUI|nr:MFS transporter [Persephonella hydrogeniphila]SNZ07853.1 MFS transporter, MHS family, proline/betaine transporter [Persephonella hydrogeniphila]
MKKHSKTLFAGMVGNVLEWYDFVVYGFLAVIIGELFFPSDDPMLSLLKSLGVFAVGFVMRPVGAILFGHIGDRYGRKKALTISIVMMAVSTTAIGLLPTYAQIGILAPTLLVILKLFQGLSVGGEYTTSVSFIVEHAPEGKRGLFGSVGILGAVVGILLGSASGAVITKVLPEDQLYAWGWRVLFFTGILLGLIGYYVRKNIDETPKFIELEYEELIDKQPVFDVFRKAFKEFLKTFSLSTFQAVGFYTIFVYIANHLTVFVKMPKSTALTINTISMVVLAVLIPFFGWLSDKIGRKPIILFSTGFTVLASYPLFRFISSGSVENALIGQIIFAVVVAGFMSILPTTLVEIFPTQIRNSGYSIGYNLPFAIFGGTAPLIATYLVKTTNNPGSPAFYLIAAAAVAFIAGLTLKETAKEPLK